VGAFVVTWIFPSIVRIIQYCDGTPPNWLIICAGTFIPSQGFCNALVYFRLRTRRRRLYDPDLSLLTVITEIIQSTLFPCCTISPSHVVKRNSTRRTTSSTSITVAFDDCEPEIPERARRRTVFSIFDTTKSAQKRVHQDVEVQRELQLSQQQLDMTIEDVNNSKQQQQQQISSMTAIRTDEKDDILTNTKGIHFIATPIPIPHLPGINENNDEDNDEMKDDYEVGGND